MAFSKCSALTSIDLPAVTSIGAGAFHNCTSLTSVNLPVATSIGTEAFYGCTALTNVNLPVAMSIEYGAFRDCTSLTSVDLPAVTSIGEGVFVGCANLKALILRTTETMCEIILTSVLDTKIATAEGMPTGEGFIYVPAALFDSYVEFFTAQIITLGLDEATAAYVANACLRKIEDYSVDGTATGALDESKI
jgi:hypothetical protein